MLKTEDLEILAIKAKNGDDVAFEKIVKELAIELKKISNKYYINGADSDDTYQEACIGVWKAVEDWDKTLGTSFRNFAINICCKRHIITAISAANRKKCDVLNSAVSLSMPLVVNDDDSQQFLSDFIPDPHETPDQQCISDEEYDLLSDKIRSKLTKLEQLIYSEYMHGRTYNEIADILNIKTKAVDNALMRIRKKASCLWISIEKDS